MVFVSLEELARLLTAELRGDGTIIVNGIAEPLCARPDQLALLTDPSRFSEGQQSKAAAFVVKRYHDQLHKPQLICADPSKALGLLLERFAPRDGSLFPRAGIDPRAAVDPTARVESSAWIGPFAYIGPRARIASEVRVDPFVYLGAGVQVGSGCWLGPGSSVAEGSSLGENVILGPGAAVGFRGFGFWRSEEGWSPLPSRGGVRIEADVEIGANTCVDAGTLGPTTIERGVKIDNLVQVGHNATIGQRALLCAQVGLAGSTKLDQDCILGGQVGVADHRRVGRGARVGAHSGVVQHVADKETVSGYPAFSQRGWLRSSALFPRLGQMARQIRELRRQMSEVLTKLAG